MRIVSQSGLDDIPADAYRLEVVKRWNPFKLNKTPYEIQAFPVNGDDYDSIVIGQYTCIEVVEMTLNDFRTAYNNGVMVFDFGRC